MNNQENSIKTALESLKVEGVHNEALIDCIGSVNHSKQAIEEHLTKWLWVSEDAKAYEGVALEYAVQLGEIEEHLVMNSLVYTD